MRRTTIVVGGVLAICGALLAWWMADGGPEASIAPHAVPDDAAALATPAPAAAPAAAAERNVEHAPPAPDTAAPADPEAPEPGRDPRHPEWRPVTLEVLDRATREPLRDVELSLVTQGGSHSMQAIDESLVLPVVARGDSPLLVPAGAAEMVTSSFLVRAPGHASATIALDFLAGGSRELLLEGACELRILVDAPPGEAALVIELRRVDEAQAWLERKSALGAEYAAAVGRRPSQWTRTRQLAAATLRRDDPGREPAELAAAAALARARWLRRAVRGGWVTFDRLAPGDWIATIVEPKPMAPLLGVAIARLQGGESAQRTITVREPEPPRAVKVGGTITLGPGWGTQEATRTPGVLEVALAQRRPGVPEGQSQRRIDQFTDVGGGLFRWDAGELVPGVYYARLARFGYAWEFELKPAESADFDLVVGPPCDVELTLVDAITGERAEVTTVSYWSGDGDSSSDAGRARRAADAASFRFRAPAGPLHVRLDWEGERYFVIERVFELAAGHSDFRFELEPKACVRLLLLDGAAVVPWNDDYHVDARRIGGRGGLGGWMDYGERDVQHVLSPSGRYSIRVADVPGFEPSEPVEIEAPPGQLVEVNVPLTRAK